MRTGWIILWTPIAAAALLVSAGCGRWLASGVAVGSGLGRAGGPPVGVTPAHTVSPGSPIYLAPGDVEVIPPGTPIVVEPTIVVPPGSSYPNAHAPLGRGVLGAPPGKGAGGMAAAGGGAVGPRDSIFDVIPRGAGPISPDLGLPRRPVVENATPNPLFVPVTNNDLAWDQLADVVTNYFPIAREQRVHHSGGLSTEGYIETPYQTGATVLEPWRNDSVGRFNRWESTLQSIRRKALLTVRPVAGGYSIYVTVLKQLEDLPRPEQALGGAAVLRSDGSLPSERVAGPGVELQSTPSPFWIDLGRDEPLEQEMLRRIRDRLAAPRSPNAPAPVL